MPSRDQLRTWGPAVTVLIAIFVHVVVLGRWSQKIESRIDMESQTNARQEVEMSSAQARHDVFADEVRKTYVPRDEWKATLDARNRELADIKDLLRDQSRKIDALYNAQITNRP